MATKINIKNLPTGYQSIITNGKHTIIGDEPTTSKGTDLGLSPSELLLSGLGMCKVATIRYIARKNGWEIRDVNAELSQVVHKGDDGKLSTKVHTEINIEGDITDAQKEDLLRHADSCYVHRMIEGEWDIEKVTELLEVTELTHQEKDPLFKV
ncbi:OsmC family protein [Flavobacterium sp. 3-210]